MIIEELDLETRSKIYSHTKKVLRKYQKGILTGKLTADKFATNILCDDAIISILDNKILCENEFKESYISYIDTLIKSQNETMNASKKKKQTKNISLNTPASITQKLKLKNMLFENGYELSMPIQYLNSSDVNTIITFVSTGEIALGNERIYKYVHKIEKH